MELCAKHAIYVGLFMGGKKENSFSERLNQTKTETKQNEENV